MVYDLIIIGGGPAGITAGIYAARQGLNSLLVTKSFGGQMAKKAVAIENYPGFGKIAGIDLIEKFKNHLKEQKIEIKKEEVIKVEKKDNSFFILTQEEKYESRAVVVASGADSRSLEVPGEKEFVGKGVSYCAICDGPLFSDKSVAVIGGGNSAFETAQFLGNLAKKIYILEYSPEIKADKENQEIVGKIDKIEIITNVALKEIKGNKFVSSVVYNNRESGEEKVLDVEGVFIEIGLQPITSFVKDLVDFNERDEIVVDLDTFETKTPGLFAAGDVNMGKFKQIAIACGEGTKATLSVFNYLKKLEK